MLFLGMKYLKLLKTVTVSLLLEQMIYSASLSVAQIGAHRHSLSRIILNPDKCPFNLSHGYVHHGSPWKIVPGYFLCFLLCYFKKDLFLTRCHMRISQKHGKPCLDQKRNLRLTTVMDTTEQQLRPNGVKMCSDYFCNHSSSQFIALFNIGCPVCQLS